jgi:hypothetical protein
MEEKKILVYEDDDANWCIIVGTNDRDKAEKALRETEDEWYGKPHMEESMLMDDFSAATIYCGTKNKQEDTYYWGDKPEEWFDDGKFTTEDGFIAPLN